VTRASRLEEAVMKTEKDGTVARREYKDGIELSIIGFGGIVVCGHEQGEADRIVARAIDRGVNYFDVAPSYFEGEAEIKLGLALKGKRDAVFLACKTEGREAELSRTELERSLKRAHSDHFDLYQFHAVTTKADVEKILGPRGAGETFLKAREEGKVRYLGASCHSVEAALALMEAFPLDSILFPINYVCAARGNFGPQVIEAAKARGIARLALKSLAHTPWAEGEERAYPKCWYRPQSDREAARSSLFYTLSQPVTAAIPPGDERLFELALGLAREFETLSLAEQGAILEAADGLEPLFRYPSSEFGA
jgi:aryl-alcohol dehydrogenase-like predicted oxidoreductase